MKTTLDLPEPLVREMKLRAAREGRKLKDVAAEVLKAGLRAPDRSSRTNAYRRKLDTPLFACEASRAEAPKMTVEELLRLERRAQAEEDAVRASHSL